MILEKVAARIPNRKYWDSYSGKIGVLGYSVNYQRMVEELTKKLSLKPGDRVVDLGCGAGGWIKANKYGFSSSVGVDFSRKMLTRAAVPFMQRNMFVQADLNTALPFSDGSFTKAVSILALGYLNEEGQRKFISEVNRILKPGGVFALITPKRDASFLKVMLDEIRLQRRSIFSIDIIKNVFPGLIAVLYGYVAQTKSRTGEFNFNSREELAGLFSNAGFDEFSCQEVYAGQAFLIVVKRR